MKGIKYGDRKRITDTCSTVAIFRFWPGSYTLSRAPIAASNSIPPPFIRVTETDQECFGAISVEGSLYEGALLPHSALVWCHPPEDITNSPIFR